MNPKKAKQLRKKVRELMLSLNISPGEGYGKYEAIKNRTEWQPALGKDGERMLDIDGVPLLKPVKVGGTLQSQWKFKLFYKFLKKLYKKGDKKYVEKILSMSEEDLLDHFQGS